VKVRNPQKGYHYFKEERLKNKYNFISLSLSRFFLNQLHYLFYVVLNLLIGSLLNIKGFIYNRETALFTCVWGWQERGEVYVQAGYVYSQA
jgi:hypothetical protein